MIKNIFYLKTARKYRADFVDLLVSLSIALAVLSFSLYLSPSVSKEISTALKMCAASIIPAVFPFMIISDFMLSYMHFENVGFIRRGFSKLFKINGYAISAFICGALCGFPIGVKIARDFYEYGLISADECERLIGFSNHASPAFVICAVGYGMRGSIRDGVILYTVSLISSLISALFFSKGKTPSSFFLNDIASADFSLSNSIRNAAYSTLGVCSFICFFAAFGGVVGIFIGNDAVLALICAFLEIGTATRLISECSIFSHSISLALSAFAVSFSGMSVHMQSRALLSGSGISMKRYYLMKLLSGVLSFVFCIFISKMQ